MVLACSSALSAEPAKVRYRLTWYGPDRFMNDHCSAGPDGITACLAIPASMDPVEHFETFETSEAAVARATDLAMDCTCLFGDSELTGWVTVDGETQEPCPAMSERRCSPSGREDFRLERIETIDLKRIEKTEDVKRTETVVRDVRFEVAK